MAEKNEDEEKPKKAITITINGKPYEVTVKKMTGAELKALGHVPAGESLYRKGHPKKSIADDEEVTLKDGEAFESAPDGGVS